MPKTIVTIPQKGVTMTRAIVRKICEDIIEKTHLPADTELLFTEVQGGQQQTANWHRVCAPERIRTAYGNFMFINFTNRYTEIGSSLNRYNKSFHKPIYYDKTTGVEINPIYAQCEYLLEITVRTKDLTRLRNWQSGIRLAQGFAPLVKQHHLFYDYNLPEIVLRTIYATTEMKLGVNATLEQKKAHYKETFSSGVSTRSNSNHSHTEVIITEAQHNRYGEADDTMFYNNLETSEGIWECTFTYKVTLDEVLALSVYVPASINNQIIPEWIIKQFAPKPNNRSKIGYLPEGMPDYGIFGTQSGTFDRYYKGDGGTRLYEWDDWFPKNVREGTVTASILLCTVDPTDPTLLFNLSEIETEYIPKAVIDYIKAYPERKCAYNDSLVGAEFFIVSETGERSSNVYIDALGNLRSAIELKPMDRHYVRFFLHTELSAFDNAHIRELLGKPTLFLPLLKLYDPTIIEDYEELHPAELPTNFAATKFNFKNILHIPNGEYITGLSFTLWLRRYPGTSKRFKKMGYTFRPQTFMSRLEC